MKGVVNKTYHRHAETKLSLLVPAKMCNIGCPIAFRDGGQT